MRKKVWHAVWLKTTLARQIPDSEVIIHRIRGTSPFDHKHIRAQRITEPPRMRVSDDQINHAGSLTAGLRKIENDKLI
jgi:hypothetical protein